MSCQLPIFNHEISFFLCICECGKDDVLTVCVIVKLNVALRALKYCFFLNHYELGVKQDDVNWEVERFFCFMFCETQNILALEEIN